MNKRDGMVKGETLPFTPHDDHQPKRPPRDWLDKATLIVAIVGTVVITASTVVAAVTAYIMNDQLTEMRAGGVDTHNLVAATKNLATAGRQQVAALTKLAGITDQQAKATAQSAGETRRMADAAQFGNALQTNAMWLADRPWVGVKSMQADEEPAPGKPFKVSIVGANSGHSPALLLHGVFDLVVETSPKMKPIAECTGCSTQTLLPGGEMNFTVTAAPSKMTDMAVSDISKGVQHIMVTARIDYLAQNGSKHLTTFCAIYVPGTLTFTACSGGNSAD